MSDVINTVGDEGPGTLSDYLTVGDKEHGTIQIQ
jgi:hypothetical protein